MARKRHTNGQKVKIIADLENRLANGESLKSVARLYGVYPQQLRAWRKVKEKLASTLSKKKSLNRGRPSSIKALEDDLIGWALEQRELGNPVNYMLLTIKAGQLSEEFRNIEKFANKYNIIRRLAKQNQLVIRSVTHVSQQTTNSMIEEAQEWQENIRALLQAPNIDEKYVANMDQVPMKHSLQPNRTLALRGSTTVGVKSRGNPKNRSTLTLGVCANGEKLKPQLIFKGRATGAIATRELPTYSTKEKILHCCQPNAWQDQNNLNQWIDKIWAPHLEDKPENVEPILFLDHFKCHKSEETKKKLEDLQTKLIIIPAGCTGAVQPIDVGIGKPTKDRLREKWIDWVHGQDELHADNTKPNRSDMSKWVDEAWDSLPADIVRNSWRKTGFSYFPNEEQP